MATRVDLNNIKSELRSLFNSANTTTANPIDLSSSLTRRVQKVLSVHPEFIPIQASHYPCVTCYISNKSMPSNDIAKDQLNSKRRGDISIDVVGAVFNQNFLDITKDPADEDINYLMENIELILRSSPSLNGSVLWQNPTSCEYYSTVLNSQVHLRVGILKLEASIFY